MDCVVWLSYGLCFSFAWVVMPVSEGSDSARRLLPAAAQQAWPQEEASIRKRLDELSARREVEAARQAQSRWRRSLRAVPVCPSAAPLLRAWSARRAIKATPVPIGAP